MESYLMITRINDFIFCPRSLLFHDFLRSNQSPDNFRETPQIRGLSAHTADNGTYSIKKNIPQGTMVYSYRYNLLGRIDIFDISTGSLTERKFSPDIDNRKFYAILFSKESCCCQKQIENFYCCRFPPRVVILLVRNKLKISTVVDQTAPSQRVRGRNKLRISTVVDSIPAIVMTLVRNKLRISTVVDLFHCRNPQTSETN